MGLTPKQPLIETPRLTIRELDERDSDFVLGLANDKHWLRFIGDRNVHDLEAAKRYIQRTMVASYRFHGFGLWLMTLKSNGDPVGICGFLQREELESVDIGFAVTREYRGMGYAHEASQAVIGHGVNVLGFRRILAVAHPENSASLGLLRKLGFTGFSEQLLGSGDQPVVISGLEPTGESALEDFR